MNESTHSIIVPGTLEYTVSRDPGEWIFVDIGFSNSKKTCGIAIGESESPRSITYAKLIGEIVRQLNEIRSPVNLLIEAPLSVAFNAQGNPTGRKIEKRGERTRYWYVGPGAATLLAAMHLLHRLSCEKLPTPIRLFEGFASFKEERGGSSHEEDVEKLRRIALGRSDKGRIIGEEELKVRPDDTLRSAFAISGMDLGVPAVVVVEDE